MTDISRACGKSTATVVHYLKAMDQWPDSTKKGTPVQYPHELLVRMKCLFDDRLGKIEARRILGVGQLQFDELVRQRLVTADNLHTKATGNTAFSRIEIISVLERLQQRAPTVDGIQGALAPLGDVVRRSRIGNLAEACRLLMDGKLQAKGILASKVGCKGILIDPREFAQACHASLGEVQTVKEFGAALALHVETVRQAIRCDLLKAIVHHGRHLITRDAAEDFSRTFVSATALAEASSTSARYVVEVLNEMGIEPILRPVEPIPTPAMKRRGRVSIYAREDVPADLCQRLDKKYPLRLVRSSA